MTMINKEEFDPSVEPASDKFHRLVRAGIGLSPMFSGTALELLNSIVEDPYNARRTRWLHTLTDALNNASIDMDKLKTDVERHNAVLSAILRSTDIALKTSDVATHNALVQLILNSIKVDSVTEELNSIYLSTISQLTASHLALLRLFKSRNRYEYGHELPKYEAILKQEIEQCNGVSKLIPYSRLLSDLHSMQLIFSPEGSPWSSGSTNYSTMMLSEFADGFLAHLDKI